MPHTGPEAESADPRWRGLFAVGGAAALITATLVAAGVVCFVVWPPPTEGPVAEWFALFQDNWLLGMLGLDLVMLASYVALIPVLVALYVALRRASQSLMALAVTFGLVAIATYFASSRIFEMAALSRQYAAATTEAQRAILEASGQSMLTTYLGSFAAPTSLPGWNFQGTAFNVSFVLWSAAAVMTSVAMLRSAIFGKPTGWLGIAGNVATCGLFVPGIGILISLLSLPLLLVWYVLIARGLFRLAQRPSTSRRLQVKAPHA
jgi:hypothetical protein